MNSDIVLALSASLEYADCTLYRESKTLPAAKDTPGVWNQI